LDGWFRLEFGAILSLKLLTKLYWEQEFTIGSCVFHCPSLLIPPLEQYNAGVQAQLLSPSVQNRNHSICIS
jgi:hypothetical protein